MPRRRAAPVTGGKPPAALLDFDSSVWDSKRSTEKWLLAQGLEVPFTHINPLDWGPLNRHKAASSAWAKRSGSREGIPVATGSSYYVERFEHDGVRTV